MKKIFATIAAMILSVAVFATKETVFEINFAEYAATHIGTIGEANITPTYGEIVSGFYYYTVDELMGGVLGNNVGVNRNTGLLRYSDIRTIGLFFNATPTFVIKGANLQAGDVIEVAWNVGGNKTESSYYDVDTAFTNVANLWRSDELGTYTMQHTSGGTIREIEYTTRQMTVVNTNADARFAIPATNGDGSNFKICIAYIKVIRGEDPEPADVTKVFEVNFAKYAAEQIGTLGEANVNMTYSASTQRVAGGDEYSISKDGLLETDKLYVNRNNGILRYADIRNIGLFFSGSTDFAFPALRAGDVIEVAWNVCGATNPASYYDVDKAFTGLTNVTYNSEQELGTYKLRHVSGGTLREIEYKTARMTVNDDGAARFNIPSVDNSGQKLSIAYIKVTRPAPAENFTNVGKFPSSGGYAAGIDAYKGGVTMTLRTGAWQRAEMGVEDKSSTENLFTHCAQIPANDPGSAHTISIHADYTGVLHMYCQYRNDLVLIDDADAGNVQHSGWSDSESDWHKIAFVLEAGHTYTLTNTRLEKRHRYAGFVFKPTNELKISEIAVGGGLTLVDGKTYDYDADFAGRVTLNRSFTSGNTYTICLPFDVDASEFERFFGNGVKVYDLVGCHEDELYFDEVTVSSTRPKIDYGYPYLITFGTDKPAGVKFFKDDSNTNQVSFNTDTKARDRTLTDPVTNEKFKVFKGALNPKTIASTNYILNAGNTIVKAGTYTAISSFRGYFDLSFSDAIVKAGAPVRIRLGNNAATGIESIDGTPVLDMNAPMYNIMGQQVDASYRGVVIQNGHKFMLQ